MRTPDLHTITGFFVYIPLRSESKSGNESAVPRLLDRAHDPDDENRACAACGPQGPECRPGSDIAAAGRPGPAPGRDESDAAPDGKR